MLKHTYKLLNSLISTISSLTGVYLGVHTPLIQDRVSQVHPSLVAMHILLLEREFLCLYVYQCRSLLPASPSAGEKELHGLQAVGSSLLHPTLGGYRTRWQRGDSWQHLSQGSNCCAECLPLPRHPTVTSFFLFFMLLKLILFLKACW